MAKAFDVHISDSVQRGIRRRCARRYPKEYGEAMFVRRGVGEFHIEKCVKISIDSADRTGLAFNELSYAAARNQARAEGLEFATFHSHPECDGGPSAFDHTEGCKEGEILMGIVEVWKDKKTGKIRTRLEFWQPQLPCKVNVIRN